MTTYTYETSFPFRLIKVQQNNGAVVKAATEYEYDGLGRLYRIKTPRPGTKNDPSPVISREYGYTTLGNIDFIKVLNQTGAQVTYDFNYTDGGVLEALEQPTRITDPLGHYEDLTYIGNGNVASHTTYRGATPGSSLIAFRTDFEYNKEDNLTLVRHPAHLVSGLRALTAFDYRFSGDPNSGRVLYRMREIGENGTTVKTVNLDNGKEGEDKGQSGNLLSHGISRDAMYRVKELKDGNNNTVSFNFDSVGNSTGVVHPLGASAVMQNPDFDGNFGKRTDGLGRETLYARNSADDSIWKVLQTGASAEDVIFEYDGFKRVTKMTDSTGVTEYDYDDLDNTLSVTSKYIVLDNVAKTSCIRTTQAETGPLSRFQSITEQEAGRSITTTITLEG